MKKILNKSEFLFCFGMQVQVPVLKDMGLVLFYFNMSIKMSNTVEDWVLRMLLLSNRGLVTFFFTVLLLQSEFSHNSVTFGLTSYKQEARRILKLWLWP